MANPLLFEADTVDRVPPFPQIEPAHVEDAVATLCDAYEAAVADIEQNAPATYAGVIDALAEAEARLEKCWGVVEHLMGVRNSDELRAVYEKAQPRIVALSSRVRQSKALYDKLAAVKASDDFAQLSPGQRRVVEQRLLSAELAGVACAPDEKKKFEELDRRLAQLSTDFSNAVLDATKGFAKILTSEEDVRGLPETWRRMAAAAAQARDHAGATPEKGPWAVTLDGPNVTAFLQHAKRRDLREEVCRAFVTRAATGPASNEPRVREILSLRQEQAALLGYASYAEMSLAQKMASSVDEVEALLGELSAKARPFAEREHHELEAMKKSTDGMDPNAALMPWDTGFLAERQKEAKFSFTDEETRPYFPLERVLQGLFSLAEELFEVRITAADGQAPVWDDDVRYFAVQNLDGSPRAAFYLDPYARPANKRGGAWMNDCIGRKSTDRGVRHPVAYLCCNQTPPSGDVPSLMSFYEVETLFHEFGHGLQHMLTTVDVPEVAGINGVEWDAVEVPSQFMENWVYEKDIAQGMSGHYQTGAKLPDDLFAKIKAARTFRAATAMIRQVYFARLDLALHHTYDPSGPEAPLDVKRRIAREVLVQQPLDEDRFLCAFTHIFAGGYSAGYYSYKWAEVLAADAFGAFEEAGLDDAAARQKLGHKFRDTILSEGGARHPMAVFEAFRGRKPEVDPLLRAYGLLDQAA